MTSTIYWAQCWLRRNQRLWGLPTGANPSEELERIKEVAVRGSGIVRQLMIYAGKESDVLEFIDISKTIEGMSGLLKSESQNVWCW
jgi:hypothetical protein